MIFILNMSKKKQLLAQIDSQLKSGNFPLIIEEEFRSTISASLSEKSLSRILRYLKKNNDLVKKYASA